MIGNKNLDTAIHVIFVLAWTSGCDERVVEVAREAADRQAAQNQLMSELQTEVARGTRSLVEADAAAREEIVGVHRDLQAERQELGASWNDLEVRRRQLIQERRTESVIVLLVSAIAGLALVLVLLSFLQRLLSLSQSTDAAGAELQQLLVEQLLAGDLRAFEAEESETEASKGPAGPGSVSLPLFPTQH